MFASVMGGPGFSRATIPAPAPHLAVLVVVEADVNRVPKQTVSRPGQKGDLGDQLRLDPVDAREDERRSEAR